MKRYKRRVISGILLMLTAIMVFIVFTGYSSLWLNRKQQQGANESRAVAKLSSWLGLQVNRDIDRIFGVGQKQKQPDTKGTGSLEATSEASSEKGAGESSSNLPNPKGQLTVLLLGVDARLGDHSLGNSDTIIVAHIDTTQNRVAFLSIPRDTQIIVPKYDKQKINAVARLENGQGATVKTVEQIIGQKIDGFVQADFAGFKEIVDTLGGITINVEKNMYYETGDNQDGVINLKKGIQLLNGTQALQYARFRHDQFADISRTARQQTVLKAIAKELTQPKTLPKLPWLIPRVYKTIKTDLGITKLWSFSGILLRWDHMEVVSQTLPGYVSDEKKISYWKVDPSQAQKVASQLFEQGKTTKVFANPPAKSTIRKPEQTSSNGKDYTNSSEVGEERPDTNSLAVKVDQVEQGLPVSTYEFEFTNTNN